MKLAGSNWVSPNGTLDTNDRDHKKLTVVLSAQILSGNGLHQQIISLMFVLNMGDPSKKADDSSFQRKG